LHNSEPTDSEGCDAGASQEMRKSSWKDSVLILVGSIMGSGTLGLVVIFAWILD
jgi:hypothetical protein